MDTITAAVMPKEAFDQIIHLKDDNLKLTEKLSSKDVLIGSKDQTIITLKAQLEELKSKQPEVTIIHRTENNRGRYDDEWVLEKKEYRNLTNVQDDIRKEVEANFKKDIKSKEENIEKLEKELKQLKATSETKLAESVATYENETSKIRLDYEKYKRNYKEDEAKKNEAIKELEKEIEKLRKDKTDEQLQAAREEELQILKDKITKLEDIIKWIRSINIFKRLFSNIIITTGSTTGTDYNGRRMIWDSIYGVYRKVRINPLKKEPVEAKSKKA